MKLISSLFIGLLYLIPFLIIHAVLGVLIFKDPHTLEVLKSVGYGALGVYTSLLFIVGTVLMIVAILMSLRHLFGLRVEAKITD